jgi:hypothetical protein
LKYLPVVNIPTSRNILVDDCINLVASKLSIKDLLSLSLVNSRLKQLFFNKFVVPAEFRLNFDQYMLILTVHDQLRVRSSCHLVTKCGTGRLQVMIGLANLYSKVLILTRKVCLAHWKIALKASNANFLILTSHKKYVPGQKIIVTTNFLLKSYSFDCDIVICDEVSFFDEASKAKYKKIIYASSIPDKL